MLGEGRIAQPGGLVLASAPRLRRVKLAQQPVGRSQPPPRARQVKHQGGQRDGADADRRTRDRVGEVVKAEADHGR
jgi:hypothetical protein